MSRILCKNHQLNVLAQFMRLQQASVRRASSYFRLVKTDTRRIYRVQPKLVSSGILANTAYKLLIRLERVVSLFSRSQDEVYMPPVPPDTVRGMTILDEAAFKNTVQVPCLTVPVAHVGHLQKVVKKNLFKMQGIKALAELAEGEPNRDKYRLFLFDPEKHPNVESFDAEIKAEFTACDVDLGSWRVLDIELTFSNWHYDDLLKAVLPEDSEGVGGFSIIGHILHLNLREELHPYKNIIGEVLMKKVASVRTVVNKTNMIDSTYRNFSMEVLMGEDDFVTISKENGFSFKMDFSKVYWNPRLGTEHHRLVSQLKKGDIVYDIMAGIGPFAVPAAKKGCHVLANDLNPESFKWLQNNITLNKVKVAVQTYNLDGREFVRTVMKPDLLSQWAGSEEGSIHIIMNLPALAVEFLDVFPGLLSGCDISTLPGVRLPVVHCYTFSSAEDKDQDVCQRIKQALGAAVPEDHTIRFVRNVAPSKDMLCAEFVLEKDLLVKCSKRQVPLVEQDTDLKDREDSEPPEKKERLEETNTLI